MVKIRLKKCYRMRKPEERSKIRPQRWRIRKKAQEVFFPDDIIIDILSRLPAENTIQCRLVCRRWRDLTSTLTFKELHMRNSIPMILVSSDEDISKSFLLDKWWEPKRSSLEYHRFVSEPHDTWRSLRSHYFGKFSHGGLIVFQRFPIPEVIILNPTSHKNVKITLSEELYSSEIYGVFFHPSLREYCTLWRIHVRGEVRYKMLNLGSKPCWKDISNPWSHRVKVQLTSPLLIGEHLYWLVRPEQQYASTCRGDVMEFDIRSEKFNMMHCPLPLDVKCAGFFEINLLDVNGVLSFVLTSRNDWVLNDRVINVSICKLKDRVQQLWLPMNHTIRIEDCPNFLVPIATVVVGEQLVLRSCEILYVCNLELRTTRTLLKEDHSLEETFSHVMSLASLKHCKSKILMNKEGEVGLESNMARLFC